MGFNHILLLSFISLLAFRVHADIPFFNPHYHHPPPPPHHQSPPPPHHSPPPPPHHQTPPPPPHHAPPPPHYGFHLPKPEEKGVKSIGVQGMIYCKENSTNLTPLKGAVARITCKACDKHGRVTGSYTVMSDDTDKTGYFLATLSLEEIKEVGNVTDCKAYLDKSSVPACSLPTNVNKGFTGASLRGPRLLRNKMHLYTVGPFEYVRFMPIGD